MKRSEEIRTMIADNSRALEDVSRAHTDIQDGLAGVDTLIRSILEVSHDMRQMTDRLAAAFSWFGETLKLREEATGTVTPGGEQLLPTREAAGMVESFENVAEAEAVESGDEDGIPAPGGVAENPPA